MTEIKYQIYHKPTKTIQMVSQIDFCNKVLDTYGIDEPIYGIPFEDVEWREYTGFKDKYNKEIGYRDICFDENIQMKYVVDEYQVAYWLVDLDRMNNPMLYLKIIGNIDQHPELLI
jgi:hypothetical protein